MPEDNVIGTSEHHPQSNVAEGEKIAAGRTRYIVTTLATAALVAGGVAVAVVAGYLHFVAPVSSRPPSPTISARVSPETLFQQSIPEASGTSDRIDEWRAARSDHKIIAYFIARCLKSDVEAMSPEMFSMLMLDLRPNGDHWRHWAADTQSSNPPGDQSPIQINGYQGAILALSDSISRARIAAATTGGGTSTRMCYGLVG